MPTKTKTASNKSKFTKRPLPDRPAHRSQTAPKPTARAIKHKDEAVVEDTKPTAPAREMYRLTQMVTDRATGIVGMLTHMQVEMDGSRFYRFQPKGLSPENGEPIKGCWIVPSRIDGGELVPEPEMPLQLLGTEAEDRATGFKGVVTSVTLHLSGCCHATLQPKGKLEKTGAPIEPHDFDVRRLSSPLLEPMTEAAITKDQKEKPSPVEVTRYTPRN